MVRRVGPDASLCECNNSVFSGNGVLLGQMLGGFLTRENVLANVLSAGELAERNENELLIINVAVTLRVDNVAHHERHGDW